MRPHSAWDRDSCGEEPTAAPWHLKCGHQEDKTDLFTVGMVGGQDTLGKSENTLSSDWMQGNHFPSENSEIVDLVAQREWEICALQVLKTQQDNILSSKMSLMRRRLD